METKDKNLDVKPIIDKEIDFSKLEVKKFSNKETEEFSLHFAKKLKRGSGPFEFIAILVVI